MTLSLPKTNQTGKNEWADVESNDVYLKEKLEALETTVGAISGLTWYTPKAIATEETRENTSFGTLTTADEIKNVVVPENGLVLIWYHAAWKQSSAELGTGRAALFLGSNQLKVAKTANASPVVSESPTSVASGVFTPLATFPLGLSSDFAGATYGGDVTTGQAVGVWGASALYGGACAVFAAAGTYDISVKYKATAGSVTAKSRTLRVAVLG